VAISGWLSSVAVIVLTCQLSRYKIGHVYFANGESLTSAQSTVRGELCDTITKAATTKNIIYFASTLNQSSYCALGNAFFISVVLVCVIECSLYALTF